MIGRMLAQSMLGLNPDLPLHPYRLTRSVEGQPLVGAYGAGAVSWQAYLGSVTRNARRVRR
jgi:hypothetical protein